MRTLIAFPWVGEFGWELMSWQGYVRKKAAEYDNVIVYSFESREPLYDDFADVFIGHDLRGDRDCWRLRKCTDPEDERELYAAADRLAKKYEADRITPSGLVPLSSQKFIKYGRVSSLPASSRYDVLLHLRQRQRTPEHNVSTRMAAELLSRLVPLRVACIGSKREAVALDGADDLRGLPLEEELNVIAGAGVVAGPSSGPMHLASLCGTPHVVWTDMRVWQSIKATNVERYQKLWNPLGTPVRVIQTATPTARQIADAIVKAMKV